MVFIQRRPVIDVRIFKIYKVKVIITEMDKVLRQKSTIKIEYISIVDEKTLEDIEYIEGSALIAIAVELGRARLIDNILIDIDK